MTDSESADVAPIKKLTIEGIEGYLARDWDRFTSIFTDDALWLP
jgi:hypothetical protein